MRKGIVMEQSRNHTIVMTSDGRFHRADRLEAAEVGMEVQFNVAEENRNLFGWTQILRDNRMKIAIATIVFFVTLLPVFSWYGSNQAYAYVNLDINPSFEMELNDKMQVIAMNPQNEEAESILALLEGWKKQDASEVTLQTIRISKQQGYVNQEEQVLVGISYVKSDQEQNSFPKEIETYLTGESAGMSIAAFYVPTSIRNEAKDSGKSVNAVMAEYLTASSSETKRASQQMTVDDTDQEIIRSFYNKDTRQVADSDPEEKEQNTKSLPNSPKPVKGTKDVEEPQFSNGQKNNSIKNGTIKKNEKGNPKPPQEGKGKQKDRPEKKEKKNKRDEMEKQDRKEQKEKEKRMKKERKEERKQERKEERKDDKKDKKERKEQRKERHHKEKGEKNKKPPKEKKNE